MQTMQIENAVVILAMLVRASPNQFLQLLLDHFRIQLYYDVATHLPPSPFRQQHTPYETNSAKVELKIALFSPLTSQKAHP